jgi:hypothetical protein
MMPVIRISDDVMDMLKKFAIPLEDTPDSVLRRILNDYTEIKKTKPQDNPTSAQRIAEHLRVNPRTATPSIKYPRRHAERCARWIIAALTDRGGSAKAEEVTSYIEKVFGREFTAKERESIPSGEIRWLKKVHFSRLDMVRGGLLNEDAPRGVWELTEKGKTFYN